jgi:hypothetical protein
MDSLEKAIEEIAERKDESVAVRVARETVAEITSECPVTLKRASKLTGVARETLEKWISQGRLRTYPCIGRIRMVKIKVVVWERCTYLNNFGPPHSRPISVRRG